MYKVFLLVLLLYFYSCYIFLYKCFEDYIDCILRYRGMGYSAPNWEKLPVLELQAHCAARGLSSAGGKAMLVQRLASTQEHVAFRKTASEMKLAWAA